VSLTIVSINLLLKAVLQALVRFEKHWTSSDQEAAYAWQAFVAQLLNSVVVLLLVNARATAADAVNEALLRDVKTSWYVRCFCNCWQWLHVQCVACQCSLYMELTSCTACAHVLPASIYGLHAALHVLKGVHGCSSVDLILTCRLLGMLMLGSHCSCS
jgi:hypothetical protein